MAVSWRHTLTASAAIAVVSIAGFAVAQSAGGHVVNVPGVTVGSTQSSSGSACCDQGKVHGIYPPGVTIPSPNLVVNSATATVGSQYIIKQGSVLESGLVVEGADTRTTFLSNGSYIPMSPPVEPSALDALNVQGSKQVKEIVTEEVPIEEEICIDQIIEQMELVAVRADCIDDTGTPHPASRVDDKQDVGAAFSGELYRCVAGTSMQVTIGHIIDGQADFSQASGFSCAKGEALVHKPGGELSCAPEVPQRNCNERSLLRKYGPGLKVVEMVVERKVCVPTVQTRIETVQREVIKEVPLATAPITFDGGVGQSTTY
ncbi:hypothetical protein [Ponticaulis profundi]|uniref:Uncharacterized protein n=1 Tax=Ponticaulis profundi TaxID=2665222 RepID=A0ABW1S5V1_9PROT